MRARRAKAAAHLSVEKVAYCHFFEFFSCFASRIRSRAAKPAKYENLRVFIRLDAHVVKAGINLRGCGPLTTPVMQIVTAHMVKEENAYMRDYVWDDKGDVKELGFHSISNS